MQSCSWDTDKVYNDFVGSQNEIISCEKLETIQFGVHDDELYTCHIKYNDETGEKSISDCSSSVSTLTDKQIKLYQTAIQNDICPVNYVCSGISNKCIPKEVQSTDFGCSDEYYEAILENGHKTCLINDVNNCGAKDNRCETDISNAKPICDINLCSFECIQNYHKSEDGTSCISNQANCDNMTCEPPENGYAICTGDHCDFECNDGFYKDNQRCKKNDDQNCGQKGKECFTQIEYAQSKCINVNCIVSCINNFIECKQDNTIFCVKDRSQCHPTCNSSDEVLCFLNNQYKCMKGVADDCHSCKPGYTQCGDNNAPLCLKEGSSDSNWNMTFKWNEANCKRFCNSSLDFTDPQSGGKHYPAKCESGQTCVQSKDTSESGQTEFHYTCEN